MKPLRVFFEYEDGDLAVRDIQHSLHVPRVPHTAGLISVVVAREHPARVRIPIEVLGSVPAHWSCRAGLNLTLRVTIDGRTHEPKCLRQLEEVFRLMEGRMACMN